MMGFFDSGAPSSGAAPILMIFCLSLSKPSIRASGLGGQPGM